MAILTSTQLAELRRRLARGSATQDWVKSDINSALQSVEDWFETNKASLITAVDDATEPGFTFSSPQKKALIAYWLLQKAGREE